MTDTLTGKTCPFCQTPFKPGAEIVACDRCRMPHHRECWAENGKCTTFGCAGSVSVTTDSSTSSATSIPLDVAAAFEEAAPTPPQERPVAVTVIACIFFLNGAGNLESLISDILYEAQGFSHLPVDASDIAGMIMSASFALAHGIIGFHLLQMRQTARKAAIVFLYGIIVIFALKIVFAAITLNGPASVYLFESAIFTLLLSGGANGVMLYFLTRPQVVAAFLTISVPPSTSRENG